MRSRTALLVILCTASWTSLSCLAPPPASTPAGWEPVQTGSSASLRGLHAVTDNLVWATGNGGTVLRTTDGGESWTSFDLGPALDLRDVHAFDSQTAYVLSVTAPASILKTEDGGRSWSEIYRSPHETAFLDSFTFLDRRRALLFGDPIEGRFQVLTTADGGVTWEPAPRVPTPGDGEAAFAASGTCVVSVGEYAWIGTGGTQSRVLRSSDGGQSWTAVTTPIISGESTTGIYSVAFRDKNHGVVVGGDYTRPSDASRNAAWTTDGGLNWTGVAEEALPRGQRAAVAWVPGSPDTLIAVGRTGTDLSTDGGRTWGALDEEGYYALSFSPTGTGWAVGADGRAARLVSGRDARRP